VRKIYERVMSRSIQLCSKKNSEPYIYLISFIESIFFPIPTDIFLFPYILAKKEKYLEITIYVTIFSVLGGVLAYFLGYFLWNIISPIVSEYHPDFISKLNNFNNQFVEIGIILIIIGGFSPFPYKITCVGSGIIGINIFLFIFFSFVSRFLRFFFVSFFIYKYGEKTQKIIGTYINVISVFLIMFFVIYLLYF
tara:strand:- start:7 stop:588 length:582 start_codon:yes stop_codon:yes gene_type:complete